MAQLENLHIIIAEDDIDDGEIIEQSFLKHPSFSKISLVKNGKELLEFLKSTHQKPDVILTDINMPIINGIEALAEISINAELNKITAFAYSTSINPTYESKCLKYGVKAFLVKPFVLEEFDEIPNKIITVIESFSK